MNDPQVRTVEDVCYQVTSGGTPSRRFTEYFHGDIPWLKTQELRDGWVYETEEHISETALRNSSAKLLPPNAVLMAMYGATVGKLAILGREMTCNQAACAMIVDPREADYWYLYYTLLNDRSRIIDRANGAAQQNLNVHTIKSELSWVWFLGFCEGAGWRSRGFEAGVVGGLEFLG
ncbi:restriction endonuclease subunit S [Acaricomes phytoseiuli]|uniref:restriction endonuclease subunit S n=1 Tax=Acaricomes phytoseiuli TaxID=291968 RepID=UPI003872C6A3